jgi:hypothetical protein
VPAGDPDDDRLAIGAVVRLDVHDGVMAVVAVGRYPGADAILIRP